MNTIPIVKQSKGPYFPPIAPAIAPRPVQVLPKPIAQGSHQDTKPLETMSRGTVPCIITSKQWVLPPRPKSGRKPSAASLEKKRQQQQQAQAQAEAQAQNQALQPHAMDKSQESRAMDQKSIELKSTQPQSVRLTRADSVTTTSSMTNLSNNLVSLNLNKSQSENIQMNTGLIMKKDDLFLKSQLETATEENQKLKSIISRLKTEIDQLQQRRRFPSVSTMQNYALGHDLSSPPPQVSTPMTNSSAIVTPRELSPSTVDPKDIGIGLAKPKKRTYKKKKKDEQQQQPVPILNTPSPILTPLATATSGTTTSNLPSIEPIMERQSSKRTKLTPSISNVKLERSISLTTDLLSPPSSIVLDRALSTPTTDTNNIPDHQWNFSSSSNHVLSRTTTNTTVDPLEFGWPESTVSLMASAGMKSDDHSHGHGMMDDDDIKKELMIRGIENDIIVEGDEVGNFLKTEQFLKVGSVDSTSHAAQPHDHDHADNELLSDVMYDEFLMI